MRRRLPSVAAIVKQSLAGHAWLGLLIGAPMYLICLSGTLAVFYQEFERWEQPLAPEVARYAPESVGMAVAAVLQRLSTAPPHLYVSLPTDAAPRVGVSTDKESEAWFVNGDGSLGEPIAHPWTHLLLHLHIYLHLPSTVGLLVVGACGALLVGLIVSGFLAHPRILVDAFRLRTGGSLHLEQVDIHNRLSVWGAPFHLVIALTGAYFGLASVLFVLLGAAFHAGDTEAATSEIYAPEPDVQGSPEAPDVAAALRGIGAVIPSGTRPSFVTVHEAGTAKQFMDVEVVLPGRLIWAEYYRFDGDGRYLGRTDYSDGAVGRQAIYSSYRLHFGNFGGLPVKVAYALFGLSLTVISVTGINIWLARRRERDYVNDLWMGTVWGAPAALALTAVTTVLFEMPSTWLFWVGLCASAAWALQVAYPQRVRRDLCIVTASLLVLLLCGYVVRFGVDRMTPAAWWVNGGVITVALVMMTIAARAVVAGPLDTVVAAGIPVADRRQ